MFARGDRRLGRAIETAWRRGARLDGWSDYFHFDLWMQALADSGIDPDFYAARARSPEEILPWDHISTGVSKRHLLHEWECALKAQISPDCRVKCTGCGANKLLCGGVCDA